MKCVVVRPAVLTYASNHVRGVGSMAQQCVALKHHKKPHTFDTQQPALSTHLLAELKHRLQRFVRLGEGKDVSTSAAAATTTVSAAAAAATTATAAAKAAATAIANATSTAATTANAATTATVTTYTCRSTHLSSHPCMYAPIQDNLNVAPSVPPSIEPTIHLPDCSYIGDLAICKQAKLWVAPPRTGLPS